MLVKLLTWSAFVSALLFVILALVGLFGWQSLGETAPMLVWYGAIPLIALSLLLSVTLLVVSAFSSDG